MENQSSSFGLHTKWLSTKNLLYPCDSKLVQRRDKLYCYLLVTSHILPYIGGDWVKTADWCRQQRAGLGRDCFQSYGRDVVGRRRPESGADEEPLRHGRERRAGCIYGAVRDILNNNSAGLRREGLLRGRGQRSVPAATSGSGRSSGTQHADAPGKPQACEQFAKEGPRLQDCLDGAGA